MAGQKHMPHGCSVLFASNNILGLALVSLPDRSRGEAEVTDHSSGFDREWLPGLRDGGTVRLQMQRLDGDAGQEALFTNYLADRQVDECVITLPDPATTDSTVITYTFDSFVINMDGDEYAAGEEEPGMLSATLRVTSAVTKATA